MPRQILYLCVLLLVGCASYQTGCASYQTMKRQKLLDETLFAYEQALCSGDYRVANTFTETEGNGHQKPDFKHLANIKVTSYELLETTVSPDSRNVQLTVELHYFHKSTFRVKTFTDKQQWEYNETEKRWCLESGLPDFR